MRDPSPVSTGVAFPAARPAVQSILPRAILEQGQLTRRGVSPPFVTSQALDWPGMLVEAGNNDVTEADDVVLSQHYLSLNVDPRPVLFEVTGAHGFRHFTLPPQTAWICPAGDPLSLRLDSTMSYVRLSLDPLHLARLLGDSPDDPTPVRFRRTFGVAVPQIVSLVKVLMAEAAARNPHGLAFVEAVAAGLGHLLVTHVGVAAPVAPHLRGGLSPRAKRRTLEVIEAELGARLTVEMLAREVGLSPAHFARAFKETMGRPPHQYLLSLRLEQARRLLERPGMRLSDVALRTGFADQAHFTRLFKRAFGLPPGALARGRRAEGAHAH